MKTYILQRIIELLNVFARRQTFIFLLPSKLTGQTRGQAHGGSPDAVSKQQLKSIAAPAFGVPAPPAALRPPHGKCQYHPVALLGR